MSGREGLSPVSAATAASTPSMTPAPARSTLAMDLRLPAFVGASVLLGVTAHAVTAGMLAGPRSVALGLVAMTALGAVHRRREARFESVTALLVVGQSVLHLVLCLDGHLPSTGHHAAPLIGLYPGHAMVVAHLLAAGVTGWWLAHGEAAAWAAARRVLRTVLPACVPVLVVVRSARPLVLEAPAELSAQVRGLLTKPRRGPPAAVTV